MGEEERRCCKYAGGKEEGERIFQLVRQRGDERRQSIIPLVMLTLQILVPCHFISVPFAGNRNEINGRNSFAVKTFKKCT